MKDRHAAFEALAGAIALGEAAEEERARYAAHAVSCSRCEGDVEQTRTLVLAAFAAAAHAESWRPFVRDAVTARIEAGRATASRRVMTALAAAVVATLGLNVALAIGVHPAAHAPDAALPAVAAATVQAAAAPERARQAALRFAVRHRVRALPAGSGIALPSVLAPQAPAVLVALPASSATLDVHH